MKPTKNATLICRVTSDEKMQIFQHAKANDMKMSEYVITKLIQYVNETKPKK